MSEIAVPSVADAEQVLALLLVAHAESARNAVPVAHDKALNSIRGFISNPAVFSRVLKKDGEIVGVLFGVVIAPYYSHHKQASDIEFYVRKDCRGHGLKLERAFEQWAKGFDAVVEFQRCVTVGGDDADKAERFYTRRGYVPVGRIMTKRVER